MEKNVCYVSHICCSRVYHWDAEHVPANVADGMDYVENSDRNLSWRPCLFGAYRARANLASEEVLCERLEICQARISDHVRDYPSTSILMAANPK